MLRRLILANRAHWAVLLAVALVARALVPMGWMPVATAHGPRLTPCASQGAPPPAMAGMHHQRHDDGRPTPPDHPCAFAGLGLAADTPPPVAAAPAPAMPPRAAPALAFAIGVGWGLAAPPPPATGPPALA